MLGIFRWVFRPVYYGYIIYKGNQFISNAELWQLIKAAESIHYYVANIKEIVVTYPDGNSKEFSQWQWQSFGKYVMLNCANIKIFVNFKK
jgi:hypothetical protein